MNFTLTTPENLTEGREYLPTQSVRPKLPWYQNQKRQYDKKTQASSTIILGKNMFPFSSGNKTGRICFDF